MRFVHHERPSVDHHAYALVSVWHDSRISSIAHTCVNTSAPFTRLFRVALLVWSSPNLPIHCSPCSFLRPSSSSFSLHTVSAGNSIGLGVSIFAFILSLPYVTGPPMWDPVSRVSSSPLYPSDVPVTLPWIPLSHVTTAASSLSRSAYAHNTQNIPRPLPECVPEF